ncbi:hypothetical protein AFL01nite_05460 [Aeromicrobium flavum]|uniref:Integrase SAM-like N-terminal domain-containing protein n=1 Tax=Aeromicrobium flavum TaxID=416568 RepID=A0A512HRY7_9ACTN|nr:hypothetical protein [Aeromicrobium flavum]GEO88219.1 hypothetical protein AFL01nite_05460 [Aeromicrobium flavum]
MSKPRLAIGTYGSIAFTATDSGRVRAETRFRDEDGSVRRITATGDSRSAAARALKARIATRRMHGEFDDITGDTSFARLAAMWLADIRDEGRLSLNTQSLYERDMRTLVLPAFEQTLRASCHDSSRGGHSPTPTTSGPCSSAGSTGPRLSPAGTAERTPDGSSPV